MPMNESDGLTDKNLSEDGKGSQESGQRDLAIECYHGEVIHLQEQETPSCFIRPGIGLRSGYMH